MLATQNIEHGGDEYSSNQLIHFALKILTDEKFDLSSVNSLLLLFGYFNSNEITSNRDNPPPMNLFSNFNQAKIRKILTHLSHCHSDKDLNLEKLISDLEEIQLNLFLQHNKITEYDHKERWDCISSAHKSASTIKRIFRTNANITAIPTLLETELSKINNKLYAQEEYQNIFFNTLEITQFKIKDSKLNILNKTHFIIEQYHQITNWLTQSINDAENFILIGKQISKPSEAITHKLECLINCYNEFKKLIELSEQCYRFQHVFDYCEMVFQKIENQLKPDFMSAINAIIIFSNDQFSDDVFKLLSYLKINSSNPLLEQQVKQLVVKYLNSSSEICSTEEGKTKIDKLLNCIIIPLLDKSEFQHDDRELVSIKTDIKLAIINYVNNTFVDNINKKNPDRSASDRRMKDIKDLLFFTNKAQDIQQLRASIEARANLILGGAGNVLNFFCLQSLYSGSSLKASVLKALSKTKENHLKQSLNK